MASPLEILSAQAAGINTCAPSVRPAAAPVQNVIVQANSLGCYSECAIPPTPGSALLKPALGETCDALSVCLQNTTTDVLAIIFNGEYNSTAPVVTAFNEFSILTNGLTLGTSTAGLRSCDTGVLAAGAGSAPTVRFLNDKFANQPVALQGFRVSVTQVTDISGNVEAQLAAPIVAFEINPWNGAIDICTRTMEVNVCNPCVGNSTQNVTTFNEACLTYVDDLHGFAYTIQPGVRVTIQACYAGIADVYNYRACSTPSFQTNGGPAY